MKKMSGGIKSFGVVVAVYLVCAASSVWADVTLQLPKNIKMFALNGKELTLKERRTTSAVKLPNGANQILVRFEGLVGMALANDSEMKYSDMIVLKFTAADKTVEIKIPNIESLYQFEKFDKNPDVKILDSTGNAIPADMDRLRSEGFQTGRDYEKELLAFNGTNSPAAVKALSMPAPTYYQAAPAPAPIYPAAPAMSAPPQGAGSMPAPPAPSPAGMSLPQGANMPEVMLKYWYDQADAATRERFKVWMNK